MLTKLIEGTFDWIAGCHANEKYGDQHCRI
jgi:hypothetical protein